MRGGKGAGSRGGVVALVAVVRLVLPGIRPSRACGSVSAGAAVEAVKVVAGVAVGGLVVVDGVVADAGAGAHAAKDARVENVHERAGLGRRGDGAGEELLGGVAGAVELLVGVAALDDGGPLEGDAGKEALCLGVAEDAGDALERGGAGGLCVAADGPRGEGDVAAERQRAGLRKRLYGAGVVEDEDKVGQLKANLAAKAGAGRGNGRGRAPGAFGQARDDEAAAEAAAAEEAGLEHRDDGQALGVGEDRGRDDLFGAKRLAGVDKGGEDLAAFLALRCARESGPRLAKSVACCFCFEAFAQDEATNGRTGEGFAHARAKALGYLHCMEEGRGLLMPIFAGL